MRIIESDESVPKAATAIECQVCQHFAEEAWKVRGGCTPRLLIHNACAAHFARCSHPSQRMFLQGLVQWLLGGPGQRLSRKRLMKYLPEICHWEVQCPSPLPRQVWAAAMKCALLCEACAHDAFAHIDQHAIRLHRCRKCSCGSTSLWKQSRSQAGQPEMESLSKPLRLAAAMKRSPRSTSCGRCARRAPPSSSPWCAGDTPYVVI